VPIWGNSLSPVAYTSRLPKQRLSVATSRARDIRDAEPSLPAPYSECRQAYEYVRAYPGANILSDNVGAVVMAGKPFLVNDPFNWSDQLARGGWPETDTNVVKLIRSRQVDLILLGSKIDPAAEAWPDSVLDAIQENYVLKSFSCNGARFVYRLRTQPQAVASARYKPTGVEIGKGR